MKKIVFILFAILITISVFPKDIEYARDMDMKFSTGIPTFGWANYNEDGNITKYYGFNYLIGYSAIYYFDELKTNTWNPYWQWGTVGLLLPYVGIGTEYLTDNGFFFNIGTIYFAPYISIGVNF